MTDTERAVQAVRMRHAHLDRISAAKIVEVTATRETRECVRTARAAGCNTAEIRAALDVALRATA